jgi:hypothetical protein
MNRWKNYVWMAAGLAALALMSAFTAKPLLAQIRAAFVENVDEPGRSPYSSTILVDANSCSVSTCALHFVPVPAGKRLIATNVTGRINVVTPGIVFHLPLFGVGGQSSAVDIPTVLMAGLTDTGSNMLAVNATILAFFDAGVQPEIDLYATMPIPAAGFPEAMTLSGYLVGCTVSSPCAAIVH